MSKKLTIEDFIIKAKKVHGDKYDYNKTDLNNRDEKGRVCIICPIHGEFWQFIDNHINKKCGCGKCGRDKLKNGKDNFIKKSKEIHGDKYDYSKVNYINNYTKVIITCPIHGDFEIEPRKHLQNRGCHKCGEIKRNMSKVLNNDIFIEKAKKIHGDKYDYSKVEYKSYKDNVMIICKKHGEFLQTPNVHLSGGGCQKCANEINVSENKLKEILSNEFEIIEYQKKFKWLGKQSLDFYLPKYNIAIEYQGNQHFEQIKYFGGEKRFKKQVELDLRKIKLCEENGVKLFHFTFLNNEYFNDCGYDVINDISTLVEAINKIGENDVLPV